MHDSVGKTKGAVGVWLYFQRNSFHSFQSHNVLPDDTGTFHSLLVLPSKYI